jgi:thioredoxin 1
MTTNIREITSLQEFTEITTQQEKAVVIDFYAIWCGPCKVIKPHFEELSNQFKYTIFD